MPLCSFWASPPRNQERAAGLCASVSTAYHYCCESYWAISVSFATQPRHAWGKQVRCPRSQHAVDEAVAIALFRERVIQELEDLVVPVRAAQETRRRPPRIRRLCSSARNLRAAVTHCVHYPFMDSRDFRNEIAAVHRSKRCRAGSPRVVMVLERFQKEEARATAPASSRFKNFGPERTLSAVSFSWLLSWFFLPPSLALAWLFWLLPWLSFSEPLSWLA
jgi:hypothetical protein